ncbi:MAG: cytochrome c-type biogenesis protein CcmH [Maricaulaceae bacterium]|jgi:cytochrome c-type biogenesis protein CcmH
MMRSISLFIAMMLVASAALAVEPSEQLDDPALEARAREVSRSLRCVVCQSQSIDESNATLARDMRLLVRERILAGDTNEEAVDYIVQRYGEYVLLAPPAEGRGLLLWLAPLVIFVAGGAVGVFVLRSARKAGAVDGGDNGGEGGAAP